jgi:5'-3' exonuclease
MPLEFSYTEDNGIKVKGVGKVTALDLLNANKNIYENEEKIKSIRYQLCDFTHVKEIEISTNDVLSIADQDNRAAAINSDMIYAIVGDKDVIYGLARMWQSYVDRSGCETGVFRSMEEAQKWIDSKLESKK